MIFVVGLIWCFYCYHYFLIFYSLLAIISLTFFMFKYGTLACYFVFIIFWTLSGNNIDNYGQSLNYDSLVNDDFDSFSYFTSFNNYLWTICYDKKIRLIKFNVVLALLLLIDCDSRVVVFMRDVFGMFVLLMRFVAVDMDER